MIPEVNITSWKASISGAGSGVLGCSESLSGGFRWQSLLREFLGSKVHLDWLNASRCSQNNYCSRLQMHKKLMWIEVHIYIVKAKIQAGNIWIKDIMTTQKG